MDELKEHKYSNEWMDLINASLLRQKHIESFFQVDPKQRILDLREALRNRETVYHVLKIMENLPNDLIHELIKPLAEIVIFGNVSNAHISRSILLNADRQIFRFELCKILNGIAQQENNNLDVLKDIALFLFSLQYKKELLDFVDEYFELLKEAEFIESDEDMEELRNMEDLNDNS